MITEELYLFTFIYTSNPLINNIISNISTIIITQKEPLYAKHIDKHSRKELRTEKYGIFTVSGIHYVARTVLVDCGHS